MVTSRIKYLTTFSVLLMCVTSIYGGSVVNFAVIADIQWQNIDHTSRYFRDSPWRLQESINVLENEDLDFTIILGDFVNNSSIEDLEDLQNAEYPNEVLDLYKKIEPNKKLTKGLNSISNSPIYYVMGNHDIKYSNKKNITDYFKTKMENVKYSIIGNNLETSFSYKFTVPGKDDYLFIVLDGNEISDRHHNSGHAVLIEQMNKAKDKINYKIYNGAISQAYLDLLDSELSNAEKNGINVILFNHFPAYPYGNAHNLWNDYEIVELISQHNCVVAYINGHNHYGNYGFNGSTHYITLKGMIQNEDENAFSIITLNENYLTGNGFRNEPDRLFKLSNKVLNNSKYFID